MVHGRGLRGRHQASQFLYQTRKCTDYLMHIRRRSTSLLTDLLPRAAIEDGIFQNLLAQSAPSRSLQRLRHIPTLLLSDSIAPDFTPGLFFFASYTQGESVTRFLAKGA